MPAAAVIPAPVAYTNVAAVKKLVVGFLVDNCGPSGLTRMSIAYYLPSYQGTRVSALGFWFFYFEKIRVFKASLRDEYISME